MLESLNKLFSSIGCVNTSLTITLTARKGEYRILDFQAQLDKSYYPPVSDIIPLFRPLVFKHLTLQVYTLDLELVCTQFFLRRKVFVMF